MIQGVSLLSLLVDQTNLCWTHNGSNLRYQDKEITFYNIDVSNQYVSSHVYLRNVT
jgi:hypothetical protein